MKSNKCKQCGKELPEEAFRSYRSRGSKVTNKPLGHYTVCKQCESFNAAVNKAYKSETRTAEQEHLLDLAKQLYRAYLGKGLQPKGAFANTLYNTTKHTSTLNDYAKQELEAVLSEVDDSKEALTALLRETFVDEPEVYQERLDALDATILGPDSKPLKEYRWLYTSCQDKIDEYEDEYYSK